MNPQRYARVKELFLATYHESGERRAKLLSQAFEDESELRQKVERLLLLHDDSEPWQFESHVLRHESSDPPDRSTSSIGPYRLVEKLGVGGMGEVYRARDTTLGRDVAIKFLHDNVATDPERLVRFEHEARVLASLNHPNVATVYSFESDGDTRFLVMELVEGETLADRFARGAMALDEAVPIFIQIADGLEAAHDKGIVHRDLKPANIALSESGTVKLLDFGLARATVANLPPDELTRSPALATPITRAGQVMGTDAYMSPEQARGLVVDKRTDIWAFACCLYEGLIGERPFEGRGSPETLSGILEDEPDWESVEELLPAKIKQLLRRCLEKDPNERLDDIAEARSALHEPMPSPGRSRAPWWAQSAVAAAVVLALGSGAWWLGTRQPGRQPPPEISSSAAGPETARKTIIVLPFENVGPAEQAYFADAMSIEITDRLGRSEGLDVMSRKSAVRYANSGKTIEEMGLELGVDYVLDGTVRWAPGERVRISPQLIRVSDNTQQWSNTYEDVLDSPFEVQSNIARQVWEQLDITLRESGGADDHERPTHSNAAYGAYLRGLDAAELMTERHSLRAIRMFRLAVEHDPLFALAWAKLSIEHALLHNSGKDRSHARLQEAERAAQQAFLHGPDLPETHTARGLLMMLSEDLDGAARELEIAAKGQPNDTGVLVLLSDVRGRQGDFEAALEVLEKSVRLDQRLLSELAWTLTFLRQYQRADEVYDQAITLVPDVVGFYAWRAWNMVLWKGWEAAESVVLPMSEDPAEGAEWLYWMALNLGRYQEALAHIAEMGSEGAVRRAYVCPKEVLRAWVYERQAETELATESWEAARVTLESLLEQRPDDARLESALGRAYAALGESSLAVLHGKRAIELQPVSKNATDGVRHLFHLAEIHAKLGQLDAAVSVLEDVLSMPALVSIPYVESQPVFQPLLQHPDYQQLRQELSSR